MHRHQSPYNGKRYLLNINTAEIHDLDFETPYCRIDEIRIEHVRMADTYDDALIQAIIVERIPNPNGCYYCIPAKHNG